MISSMLWKQIDDAWVFFCYSTIKMNRKEWAEHVFSGDFQYGTGLSKMVKRESNSCCFHIHLRLKETHGSISQKRKEIRIHWRWTQLNSYGIYELLLSFSLNSTIWSVSKCWNFYLMFTHAFTTYILRILWLMF